VAQAHGVGTQAVTDALVADGRSELADQVKNGTLTQAQADAEQANLTKRVTDQVNGVHPDGGPGRPDDHDADDAGSAAPSPSTS
jgi:hypothetical protein